MALFPASVLAKNQNWPTKGAWAENSVLDTAFVPLGAVAAAYAGRFVVYRAKHERAERRRKIARELDILCRKAAAHLDQECPRIKLAQTGIHIWTTTGVRAKQLERTNTFRLLGRNPTAVKWTKGKGVIGLCWEKKAPVTRDLAATLYPVLDSKTEQAFDRLPERQRLGMTYDEVEQTRHWQAILAFPLLSERNRGKLLGVLSVDSATPGQFDCIKEATQASDRFQDILQSCQAYLEEMD